MALVTITGFPCSGKTTRALEIKALLESRQSLPVILINDESQNISKQAYDGAMVPQASSSYARLTSDFLLCAFTTARRDLREVCQGITILCRHTEPLA